MSKEEWIERYTKALAKRLDGDTEFASMLAENVDDETINEFIGATRCSLK